jgi:hypothetical protein
MPQNGRTGRSSCASVINCWYDWYMPLAFNILHEIFASLVPLDSKSGISSIISKRWRFTSNRSPRSWPPPTRHNLPDSDAGRPGARCHSGRWFQEGALGPRLAGAAVVLAGVICVALALSGAAVGRRRQSLIFSTLPLKKPLLEMTSEAVVMFPFARPVSVISTLPVATTLERSHHQRDLQGRGGRALTQGGSSNVARYVVMLDGNWTIFRDANTSSVQGIHDSSTCLSNA